MEISNKFYVKVRNSSIGNIETSNIFVYPNPFTDILTIQNSDLSIKSIYLSDLNGKKILEFPEVNNSEIQVNLKSLANGVYLIHIANKNGSNEMKKVVKE